MIRLIIIGLIVVGLLIYSGIQSVFGATVPTSISMIRADAYKGVLETGDVLFIGMFDIVYDDCNQTTQTGCPTDTVNNAFLANLVDDNELTPCDVGTAHFRSFVPINTTAASFNGYNRGVFGIYVSAASVSDGTPDAIRVDNPCHALEIEGNPAFFASPPSARSVITWRSGGSAVVATAIRNRAADLEASWGATLTQESGTQLDATGENYFEAAIPDLRSFAPDVFGEIVVAIEPNLSDFTNQTGYADGLENFGVGNQFIDNANSQFTLLGTTFGVPSVWLKSSIAIGIALASVVAGLALTGDFRMGLLAFPLTLSIMTLMGFGVLALVAIMTFMAALFLSYMFFLKGVT